MWKAPRLAWREESKLLNGFEEIIKEEWPYLEMYFTSRGWERKLRYGTEIEGGYTLVVPNDKKKDTVA